MSLQLCRKVFSFFFKSSPRLSFSRPVEDRKSRNLLPTNFKLQNDSENDDEEKLGSPTGENSQVSFLQKRNFFAKLVRKWF